MRYSLFLYPEIKPQFGLKKNELVDLLAQMKFCQQTASAEVLHAGEQLMDYITFLGCSPALEPDASSALIAIHRYHEIVAMGGEAIDMIRYPGCKHPLRNAAELLSNYPQSKLWKCPECGQQGEIEQINWRKSAGFSRLFIEISPIFPKEAVPSDRLMDTLNDATQSHWHWFYSKSTVQPGA